MGNEGQTYHHHHITHSVGVESALNASSAVVFSYEYKCKWSAHIPNEKKTLRRFYSPSPVSVCPRAASRSCRLLGDDPMQDAWFVSRPPRTPTQKQRQQARMQIEMDREKWPFFFSSKLFEIATTIQPNRHNKLLQPSSGGMSGTASHGSSPAQTPTPKRRGLVPDTRSKLIDEQVLGELRKVQDMQRLVDEARTAQCASACARRVEEDLRAGFAALFLECRFNRIKELLEKARLNVINTVQSRFGCWARSAQGRLHGSLLAQRSAKAFLQSSLRRVSNTWALFAARRGARRRGVSVALARWRQQELVVAIELLAAVAAQKRRMGRAARALTHRGLKRAVEGWKASAADSAALQDLGRSALRGMTTQGRAKRAALNSWRFYFGQMQVPEPSCVPL